MAGGDVAHQPHSVRPSSLFVDCYAWSEERGASVAHQLHSVRPSRYLLTVDCYELIVSARGVLRVATSRINSIAFGHRPTTHCRTTHRRTVHRPTDLRSIQPFNPTKIKGATFKKIKRAIRPVKEIDLTKHAVNRGVFDNVRFGSGIQARDDAGGSPGKNRRRGPRTIPENRHQYRR